MAVFHPYRAGFSVLPNLRRIRPADVFDTTAEELSQFLELKREARVSQIWHVERDCSDEIQEAARRFILDHYPLPLDSNLSLIELSTTIAEDLVIHRRAEGRDWMALGCVHLPSHWRPEERIGQSFREVHEVVPGMDLSKSDKLVDAMIRGGPFERFLWGPLFEDRLNAHPRFPRREFDPQRPILFIKVERQVLVGLPAVDACLFVLKQSLIPCAEIDKTALLAALEGMTREQMAYKGLTVSGPPLIDWLKNAVTPERH